MKHTQVARTARRLYRLCLVNGRLDSDRARHVAGRLAASRHRGSLPVLERLARLVRLERDRRRAVVTSAVPLAEEMRDDVRHRLDHAHGGGLATTFVQDPTLIAGLRVRVGSNVYDGSVRAKLAALETRM